MYCIKFIKLLFVIAVLEFILTSQIAYSQGIDDSINRTLEPLAKIISNIIFFSLEYNEAKIPLIVVWLLVGALFFTFYFGFINVRAFLHAIRITKGDYQKPGQKGEVSHFQALTTALSATVGLGNIAGVAIAISLGGPGATFWMILGGFLGMSSKFVECTLGVKYRDIDKTGMVFGGPMQYLKKGFANKGFPELGIFFAGFFAVMCIGGSFGIGNMFQINQATKQFVYITGGPLSFFYNNEWLFGLIMAIILAVIIIGGIKKIAVVTGKIVPIMCLFYVLSALAIIIINISELPNTLMLILKGAFAPDAITGGIIGVMIQGFKRSTFSNEAGIGSAAIAHSAVKTDEPITEGLVSLLEPFIDTVVICTITALVIIITNSYGADSLEGIELTSRAFDSIFDWFPFFLAVSVILFAFSTAISWSYYGVQAWQFIFGVTRFSRISYQLIFCIFVILGSSMDIASIVDFSDAMVFAMAVPNLIGLYLLSGEVKKDLKSYLYRVKIGEIKKMK